MTHSYIDGMQEKGSDPFSCTAGEENGMKATAKLTYTDWNEETYATTAAGKLTRASVKQTAAGDIDGESSAEWLMCYRADDTADFLGLQRVDGRLGERSGSFVLET